VAGRQPGRGAPRGAHGRFQGAVRQVGGVLERHRHRTPPPAATEAATVVRPSSWQPSNWHNSAVRVPSRWVAGWVKLRDVMIGSTPVRTGRGSISRRRRCSRRPRPERSRARPAPAPGVRSG
jgi:hypothetical protein